jgi:hypothetical protein
LRLGLCKTHVEREASTRKSRRTCASGMCLCKMDLMSEKFRRRTVGSHVIDSPKSLGYVHVFYGPKSQKKTSDGAARIPFLGLSESTFFASELARIFFQADPITSGSHRCGTVSRIRVVGNQRMMQTNAAPQSDNSKH